MKSITKQVTLVVCAVALFAALAGAGYLAQVSRGQNFGPSNEDGSGTNTNPNASNSQKGNTAKREPIPEGESVWEDYPEEDLDNLKRLPGRPGNFEVLTRLGLFYEGAYQVEPEFPHMAFPFQQDSGVYETLEEWLEEDAELVRKTRESGKKRKNKLRQYNVVIHKITLLEFEGDSTAIPNFADLGLSQSNVDRFAVVRKRHPGRCVLTLVRVGLESLQSDKVEGDSSDSDHILCWSMTDEGWKLVWFDK